LAAEGYLMQVATNPKIWNLWNLPKEILN